MTTNYADPAATNVELTEEPRVNSAKKCPYCAEDIRVEATVCRFCQRSLAPSGFMRATKFMMSPGGIFFALPIVAVFQLLFAVVDGVAALLTQSALIAASAMILGIVHDSIAGVAQRNGLDAAAEARQVTTMTYATATASIVALWVVGLSTSELPSGLLLFGLVPAGLIMTVLWGYRLQRFGSTVAKVQSLRRVGWTLRAAGITSMTIVGVIVGWPLVVLASVLARRAALGADVMREPERATLRDLFARFRVPVAVVAVVAVIAVLPIGQTKGRKGFSPMSMIASIGGDSIEVDIRTATVDKLLADQFNRYLSDATITKDVDRGTLTIRFRMDKALACPGCTYLVRLFDKNGRYITHFTTEEFHELFRTNGEWQVPDPVELTYPVSSRDLREIKMAEFGVLP